MGSKAGRGSRGGGSPDVGLVSPGWLLRCSEQQDGASHQDSGAEFPYMRDKAASLYNTYLQVWKEAKIILTAIVCTYNFLVVLLNLGFVNKHFGKSTSPSHAV